MSGVLPPPPLNAPRGSKQWIFYQSLNGHRKGQDSKLWHPHAQPCPCAVPPPPGFPRYNLGKMWLPPRGEKPGFALALPPSACWAVCNRETSLQ